MQFYSFDAVDHLRNRVVAGLLATVIVLVIVAIGFILGWLSTW